MARTLVGTLMLRLQQNVSSEAGKVRTALKGIETASRDLNSHSPRWGSKFDSALERLKVSPAERAAVVESWNRLLNSIDGAGNARGPAKASWRTGVLGHLALIRSEINSTNERARVLGETLRGTLGIAGRYVVGGTLAYGGYTAARGATTAAFEQQRVEAQGHFAGLSEGDQASLKTAAEELSAKYGLAMSNVLQALQEASLSMPSTADALASGDSIARLLTALEPIYGSEGAVAGAYSILRGLDNVAMNQTPEQVLKALDAFMRAQQVLGKDFSPDAFRQMLQYSRIAGKALDDDFLLTWMPILASETAGADAGTRLRANFDQFIVGRASAEAEGVQKKYGIRTDETGLIGQDAYAANPVLWAHDYLLPALKEAGVNTEDPVALASALGEITNNRQSSDFLAASLVSFEQYLRTATERIPAASGLSAADEVRDLDPFATVQGLVNSLSNLSGALGEHVVPVIIPALNVLSGGIEGIASAVRGAEGWEVGFGAVAAVAGGLGALSIGKVGLAWITAGPSLQTAAVMLQEAALSIKGGSPTDGPWGDKPKGPGQSGPISRFLNLVAGIPIPEVRLFTPEEIAANASGYHPAPLPSPYEIGEFGGMQDSPMMTGEEPAPRHPFGYSPGDQAASLEALNTKAAAAGTALDALNGTVNPHVDTASLQAALDLANRLAAALQSIGSLASAKAAGVRDQVNSSYSDFGVAP